MRYNQGNVFKINKKVQEISNFFKDGFVALKTVLIIKTCYFISPLPPEINAYNLWDSSS